MAEQSVTVLGAGNTGTAVAANLTLAGFQVTLGELPEFSDAVDPLVGEPVIHLFGVARTGPATIHRVTTDVGQAVRASEVLLLLVPAYGHAPWVRAIAPHLRAGQILTLLPGTLGSLEAARILREADAASVMVAETDTAPYVCRRTRPDAATIWGVVPHVGLGVFPASETEPVRARLDAFFPGIVSYSNVLQCGLSAMNPVVHPAGVILNAGGIERSRGEFYFYDEGVTPGVVDVIMTVDAERRAVGSALGFELMDVAQAFAAAGFGPKGDLWATINGSEMLTALKAPGALNTRWLSEDVPYGLGIWSTLADRLGVDTPTIDAVVSLGLVLLHLPPGTIRRTPSDLGIDGMSRDEMLAYVHTARA